MATRRSSRGAWPVDPVFAWLKSTGNLDDTEMYRTFNCGIGMTVCVAEQHVDAALARLKQAGERPLVIGAVRGGSRGVVIET